jgi:hypothetical protein
MNNEQAYQSLRARLLAHGQHTNRLWYWHSRALASRLARVHPETGGHYGMAHNWGNAEAQSALVLGRERWARYSAYRERAGSAIIAEMVAATREAA